jgi:hypothetical protein
MATKTKERAKSRITKAQLKELNRQREAQPKAEVIRAAAVGNLATLKVEIRRNGKVVRIEEFPDPREEFCRFFNEQRERVEAMVKQATKAARFAALGKVKFTAPRLK